MTRNAQTLARSTIAALAPLAAHAELFNIGSTFTVNGTGSPTSFSNGIPLTPGFHSLDGGLLNLNLAIIPTTGGGEWLDFKFSTPGGTAISNSAINWGLTESGLHAAVGVNFDGGFNGADINGVNQTFTGSPFGNFSPGTSPLFGAGLLTNANFSSPTGPGPIFDLFSFIDPFGILNGDGINANALTSWEQAWHFDPQVVTGVPEPASLALLGFGALGLVAVRNRRRPGSSLPA